MTPLEDKRLRVADVCDLLGVTERAVRAWLKSGELFGVNFSGRTGYRIKASELERFLAQRELAAKLGREALADAGSDRPK